MQNSSEEYSFGKCSAVDIQVTLFGVTGYVGLIGHLLLLWFAIEEWLKKKTADRLLVLNLSITNLLVLLPGIPIHLMYLRTTNVDLLCSHFQSTPMLFKRGLESACDLVNIATFVLISFNRREALTKLPHQRKLNIPLTCALIAVAWVLSIVVVVLVTVLPWLNTCIYKDYPFIPLSVVICVWNVGGCVSSTYNFTKAVSDYRKRQREIVLKFGPGRAAGKIQFTKTCTVFNVVYMLTWLPHGISRVYFWQVSFMVAEWFCWMYWLKSVTYLRYVSIAVIYMGMDKRFGSFCSKKWKKIRSLGNPPPDPGQEPSHPATDQEALQPRAAQSAIFTRRNAWTVEIPRDHIMPRNWENGYPGNPVGSVLTGGTVLHQCHRIEINRNMHGTGTEHEQHDSNLQNSTSSVSFY